MWAGLALSLLFASSTLGRVAARSRYECDLTPGPPARAQVHLVLEESRLPIGPELVYPHQAKTASAADIDGDGRLDLLLLVWKTTRYDRQLAWRPFVYTLRDGRWVPKWLGSRVGRPLVEAALVHTPHGVRMLTIEHFGEAETVLTLYHWRGFGFWGEWTGQPSGLMSGLRVTDWDGDGVDEISVSVGERREMYVFRGDGYVADDSCGEEE